MDELLDIHKISLRTFDNLSGDIPVTSAPFTWNAETLQIVDDEILLISRRYL